MLFRSELLPRAANGDGAFVDLLKRYGDDAATLQQMLRALWTDMDRGGFSAAPRCPPSRMSSSMTMQARWWSNVQAARNFRSAWVG